MIADRCLCGEHIMLIPMNMEDSERYRILRNRDENRKWFFSGTLISKEEQKIWFEKFQESKEGFFFSVYGQNTELFLGAISVYNINMEKKSAEVGRIVIDSVLCRGKGYGTEAIRLICEFARTALGLSFVYANILTDNEASRHAFEKAGFIKEFQTKKETYFELKLM